MSVLNGCSTRAGLLAFLLCALVAGCGGGGSSGGSVTGASGAAVVPGAAGSAGAAATNPTVGSSNPGSGTTNVATSSTGRTNVVTGTQLNATFTQAMNPATLVSPATTFTLMVTNGANVPGTVTMNSANTVATFTPTATALSPNTSYTATITTAATNAGGTPMPNPVTWSFTTGAAFTAQAPVDLGTAGDFVIFANTGIAQAVVTVPPVITGDMGVGPGVTSTAITGFALTVDASNTFSTSAQVTGKIYARDYIGPPATTPTKVNTASLDMTAAYNDAAGRTAGVGASNLNLGAGTLTTRTLTPGVYTWGTAVNVPAGNTLTLSGGPNDVWLFQIAGTLSVPATASVSLSGGALPKNVFWQVGGSSATMGAAPTHFEGVVLCGPICAINFGNGATANSRLLSQTAVNLSATTVTQPAP